MSPVLTIFRKELRSYVMTPYGWVILAFVMALQSVSLSGTLKAFQLAPQKEGILFFILHSPMFWFYFLFIFPLLTMRSLADISPHTPFTSSCGCPCFSIPSWRTGPT